MLFKLSFRNAKRQLGNYLIYFITVTIIVALVFSLNNLIFSDMLKELQSHEDLAHLTPMLYGFSFLLIIVVAFVLSYATAFLLRRRKKEFGLYLTLGMTRGNILALFMGETLVTFLFSLAFGMLLGLGVYQAFMSILISFLEMEYAVSGYSATAVVLTVAMSAGMFVLSSAVSLWYLRFTKISKLLHGENRAEKTIKRPAVWLGVGIFAVGLLIGSVIWLADWLYDENYDFRFYEVIGIVILLCAGTVLLPAAVSKSVFPLCIRRNEKTQSAQGTAVFTMRQLSGRLNANSVMVGVLTFLLMFAVIASNIALVQGNYYKAENRNDYPYDIRFLNGSNKPYDYDRQLAVIEKLADVNKCCRYRVYYGANLYGYIMTESGYNELCTLLKQTPVKLNGGFKVSYSKDSASSQRFTERFNEDYADAELLLGEAAYRCEGYCVRINNLVTNNGEWDGSAVLVIPDDSKGLDELSFYELCAVTLKSPHYDARLLHDELMKITYEDSHDIIPILQKYEFLFWVGPVSIYVLMCIFVAITFILLSMAMLALKMLTMLEEDKPRYKTLYRLGADRSMIFKSLFSQMFFFYFLPFALPIIASGVMVPFLVEMVAKKGAGAAVSGIAVFGQAIAFSGFLIALYALYFTVTYLIARKDIKRTLQAVG